MERALINDYKCLVQRFYFLQASTFLVHIFSFAAVILSSSIAVIQYKACPRKFLLKILVAHKYITMVVMLSDI